MLEFRPMTAESYRQFLDFSVTDYAEEKVRSGEWEEATAPLRAQEEFAGLLPDGAKTEGHFLYDVVDPSRNEAVGVLWFALRGPEHRRSVFVYEIRVYPAFQRRGYASRIFERLSAQARDLGAGSVRLHVFGHNHGARALYEKLGFVTTNVIMQLDVSPARPGFANH
ncbi:GNAT family N-acetyltransferase [Deinococcus navajonensis]|uniref:GNAT family N-acetyltransferase n=1 Tax=Deinococcus navajonensis TaxID=309884 RepID=A0ABV8XQE0_9DEIO